MTRPPPSGRLEEYPLALVMGAAAVQGFSGELRVEQELRVWRQLWRNGAVVAAESAVPDDQLGRAALEAGLIDPAALAESLRRMAASGKKQLDVLVEMGALAGDAVARAARLCLAKCATRPFSAAQGVYALDARAVEVPAGAPSLDARWLIYRGLRLYCDERRLDRDLAPLAGKAIKLRGEADPVQDRFGFADDERILLAYLQKGFWEPTDLVDAAVSLARPVVLAVVCALHACEALEVQAAESVPRLRKRAREATQRIPSETLQAVAAAPPLPAPTLSPRHTGPIAIQPPPPAMPPVAPAAKPPTGPPQGRPPVSAALSPVDQQVADALREQIVAKARQIDSGVDHFAALDLDRGASKEQVKAAYFQLAKSYHPDRLAIVRLEELRPRVERIFARLSEAFSILADDNRRKEYLQILAQGGEAAVQKRNDAEAAKAVAILSAEESFRRGEMALRRQQFAQALDEFKKSVELNPDEAEHHAMHAWALWCVTPEKEKIVTEVKKGLNKALELNPRCVPAFYHLGLVYNQLGDVDRAYNHFQKTVSLSPGHVDAAREIRVIEMRRQKPPDRKGLLDLFKKK